MKNYKISIIIPVYNTEKYIKECIESIIKQTYKNIEIIIVNDGSTDNSVNIIKDYQKKYKRIKVINQKNKGPSAARNNGIKHSEGDYILFVDSDDWIEENMVEKMINSINNKETDLIICSYSQITNGKRKDFIVEERKNFEEYLFDSSVSGYSCCKMIKRECIKNYFDEELNIMEDLLFWYSNKDSIIIIKIVKDPLYYYRIHESSLVRKKIADPKRIKLFDVCIFLISNISQKYQLQYKIIYVQNYYLYYKHLEEKYYKKYKKYLKDVMKNDINLILKIKIIIKYLIIKVRKKYYKYNKFQGDLLWRK